MFHWKEETSQAMMDELEWPREDSKLSTEERDRAINELIAIVGDVDSILQDQSTTDDQRKRVGAALATLA